MSKASTRWVRTPIGDLCELRNGRAFKPTEWARNGIPIVRIQNLNNCGAGFNYYQGRFDERHALAGGELLFAWSGTPGTSFGAHIWQGGEAVLNQHIFRVDFDVRVLDKRFFKHAINQKLSELIGMADGGVGLRHVTKGMFERTTVDVPPIAEQKRIADKLDTLLARIDACRERLDRVSVLIKRLRRAVLVSAIAGELTASWREQTGAGKEWETTTIDAVATVGTGSTPLRSNGSFYAPAGIAWITSAATGREFITEATELVTDEAVKAHRLRRYAPGTLLVAMYGEGKTRGQVSELAIEATINQACAAIAVDESKADRRFVRLMLQAHYFEMRALAEGGNQPNLNLSKVKEFTIPLPPHPEQVEIVRRADHLFAMATRLEARLLTAHRIAARLTPSTLAKAFRGELVTQDRADEPAPALLCHLQRTPSSTAPIRSRRRAAVSTS